MKNTRQFCLSLAGTEFELKGGKFAFVFEFQKMKNEYDINCINMQTFEIVPIRTSTQLVIGGYSVKKAVKAAFDKVGTGFFATLLDGQSHDIWGVKASHLMLNPDIEIENGIKQYTKWREDDGTDLSQIELDIIEAILEFYREREVVA